MISGKKKLDKAVKRKSSPQGFPSLVSVQVMLATIKDASTAFVNDYELLSKRFKEGTLTSRQKHLIRLISSATKSIQISRKENERFNSIFIYETVKSLTLVYRLVLEANLDHSAQESLLRAILPGKRPITVAPGLLKTQNQLREKGHTTNYSGGAFNAALAAAGTVFDCSARTLMKRLDEEGQLEVLRRELNLKRAPSRG